MGTRLLFAVPRVHRYVGVSRCRNATGLYYFKRLRRTDWLPIGGGESDEESERGDVSDADSFDPYDGWCDDGSESDCNTLRSDVLVWLCVTNKGVRDVNLATISQFSPPITEADLASRVFPTDPHVGKNGYIVRPLALLYASHGILSRIVVSLMEL